MNAGAVLGIIVTVISGANFVVMLQVKLEMQRIQTQMAEQRASDMQLLIAADTESRHQLRNEMQAELGKMDGRIRSLEMAVERLKGESNNRG